jgi:hypothetical protein
VLRSGWDELFRVTLERVNGGVSVAKSFVGG